MPLNNATKSQTLSEREKRKKLKSRTRICKVNLFMFPRIKCDCASCFIFLPICPFATRFVFMRSIEMRYQATDEISFAMKIRTKNELRSQSAWISASFKPIEKLRVLQILVCANSMLTPLRLAIPLRVHCCPSTQRGTVLFYLG